MSRSLLLLVLLLLFLILPLFLLILALRRLRRTLLLLGFTVLIIIIHVGNGDHIGNKCLDHHPLFLFLFIFSKRRSGRSWSGGAAVVIETAVALLPMTPILAVAIRRSVFLFHTAMFSRMKVNVATVFVAKNVPQRLALLVVTILPCR